MILIGHYAKKNQKELLMRNVEHVARLIPIHRESRPKGWAAALLHRHESTAPKTILPIKLNMKHYRLTTRNCCN